MKMYHVKETIILSITILLLYGCSVPGVTPLYSKSCNSLNLENTTVSKSIQGSPNYEFAARENQSFTYTYWEDFNFSANNHIVLSTSKVGSFYPTIYLFYKADPMKSTWTNNNSSKLLDATIRESGEYRCLVKTTDKSSGLCNLYLNGSLFRRNIIVSGGAIFSTFKKPERPNTQLGNSFFTCNTTSGGDTVLYVLSRSNPQGVVAWNDDYNTSNPLWYHNSRCSWNKAADAPPVILLVFAYGVWSQGYTDIYGYVKSSSDYGDCFKSSTSANGDYYNCFAWSGGITSKPVDPGAQSWWNDGTRTDIEAFDNFYANRGNWDGKQYHPLERYPGAPTYVPCPIDDPMAVIDLWGEDPNCGSTRGNVWHATVKRTANNQYHGFGWESKMDYRGDRYFHDRRTAILSNNYGTIIRSYKLQ